MEKSEESRTRRDKQMRKYSKMDKRAKDNLVKRMEEDRMPKKDLHSRTGRDETKWKTQEKTERGSRKISFKCWE
jgi:hypothetical protein